MARSKPSAFRPQPRSGVLQLPEQSPLPYLARRILLAIGLIVLVAILLWFNRDGLRDNTDPERPLGLADVFYFTVVTLTTVGYGDITPVTAEARLVNAIFLTPVRVFLWMLFLGTAYGLILQQYREKVQMQKLQKRLRNHAIVCGFGVKGRAIITELLAHGHCKDDIVVIDNDPTMAQDAASQGFVSLCGDASSESILQSAVVKSAAHVLVAPNRDDASVLICLTVRTLAPKVRLIAAAREDENVKLLYKAGADVVVAASVSGGRLMAAAVQQQAVVSFLDDLLTFGEGLDAGERAVRPDEAGKYAPELPDLQDKLILGLARGSTRYSFQRLRHLPLQPGDVIVYLTGPNNPPPRS